MDSSRPIISRPQMPIDQPGSLAERHDDDSQRRDGSSRRSSISRAASRGSTTRPRSSSRHSQDSKRGRKGYELAEDVDRGLVTFVHSTDVPFETVAEAVEKVGGPKKLWLRKRFEQITGTKSFGGLRLSSHRPSAEDRKQRTLIALEWSRDLGLHQIGHAQPQREAQHVPQHLFPRNELLFDRSSRPISSIGTASTTKASASGNAPPAQGRGARQSWAASGTKRTLSDDDRDSPTSYASNRNRARALSISSITRQLENLTGNTGFYEFVRRGSIKSHVSPLFRPSWWSSHRGSRATDSGRASYPGPGDKSHVIYVPDLTYETHYHHPTQEDVACTELMGALAVSLLLHARMSKVSDETTKAQLTAACLKEGENVKSYLDRADKNGVTALHLAVAYGFQHVAAFLMRSGVNHRALTAQGSSVCRFAKPAQGLSADDTPLYSRILHSRQWVCAGLPPRLPSEEKVSPVYERIKPSEAIPTLPTVAEASTPELNSQTQGSTQRRHTATSTGFELPTLSTDFTFPRDGEMSGSQRNTTLQIDSFYFNDSPTSNSLQHCVQDHGQIGNLMTPDSVPRSAVSWSMESSSPESTFRFPPSLQTAMPSHQGHGSFADQLTSNEAGSFGGLGILTGSMDQAMSAVTSATPWLAAYTSAPDLSAQTAHFAQNSAEYYASEGAQFEGHMAEDIPPNMNSRSVAAGYTGAGQYHLAHGQQHAPFSTSTGQLLYPTPPDDGGWPRNQQLPNQNWPSWNNDVSHATARALAETFQTTAWNPEPSSSQQHQQQQQQTRTNDDYLYFQQHSTNQFH